jgi:hypothetical protein
MDLSCEAFRSPSLCPRNWPGNIGWTGICGPPACGRSCPGGPMPLGPENLIIIASGPMSGHLMPASGKTHFGCKSPATGGYADSNMGGHFGPS